MSYNTVPGNVAVSLQTDASQFNPSDQVPIIPPSAIATFDSQRTLTTGPLKIGAGGEIIKVRFTSAEDTILDVCEVAISNADGTEYLDIATAAPIDLTANVERDLAAADYTTNAQTGTDITIGTDGTITSTAGGVFWVSALTGIKQS